MSVQKINIVVFGLGTIGSTVINSAIKEQKVLLEKEGLDLSFPVITNSTVAFFEKESLKNSWEANFTQFPIPFQFEAVVAYVKAQHLENLIAIDATGSEALVRDYDTLIRNDFDVISVNNTLSRVHPAFNTEINGMLRKFGKQFFYLHPDGKNSAETAKALLQKIILIARQKQLEIAV